MGNPSSFRVHQASRVRYSPGRVTAEIATAAIGVALVVCAAAANQHWLDSHFLPSFFLPRDFYVRLETIVRVAIGAIGLWLALGARPPIAQFLRRTPGRAPQVVIAAGLALGTSEAVLRRVHLGPTEWLSAKEEPRRRADPRLGWVLAPARTRHDLLGGRTV